MNMHYTGNAIISSVCMNMHYTGNAIISGACMNMHYTGNAIISSVCMYMVMLVGCSSCHTQCTSNCDIIEYN